MKALLNIEASDEQKIWLLLRIAKEMGISVQSQPVIDEYSLISTESLSEAWDSVEDERWGHFFSKR